MKASPAWLAVTVPLFVLAVCLLIVTVRSLVRTLRRAVVAKVPVSAEQTLVLEKPGVYDLYVEGRQFSTDFRGLEFTLTHSSGSAVPSRPVWFRTHVSSFSRVRLQLRRFNVEAGGQFTLRVGGIKPDQNPENRLIFSRPVRGAVVGHVLALVVLGQIAVGSLVGSIFLLALGRGAGPS